MNEKELKHSINEIRNVIAEKNKGIKEIYDQMNFHRDEISKFKTARDELNKTARDSIEKISVFKEHREAIKRNIEELRSTRESIIVEAKNLNNEIKKNKAERDDFNKLAKAPFNILEEHLDKIVEKLIYADLPLEYEKNLFKRVFDLKERIEASKKANNAHSYVLSIYSTVRQLDDKISDLNNRIEDERNKLNKSYEESRDIYDKITKSKEEANRNHDAVIENYVKVMSLKAKIDRIKAEIKEQQDAMKPFLDQIEDIRAEKEKVRMEEKIMDIKKKLATKKKRLTLEELRVVLDEVSK